MSYETRAIYTEQPEQPAREVQTPNGTYYEIHAGTKTPTLAEQIERTPAEEFLVGVLTDMGQIRFTSHGTLLHAELAPKEQPHFLYSPTGLHQEERPELFIFAPYDTPESRNGIQRLANSLINSWPEEKKKDTILLAATLERTTEEPKGNIVLEGTIQKPQTPTQFAA
jgi:hypothetical protein